MSILSISENDKLQIDTAASQAEDNAGYYTNISDSIVKTYSEDLDKLMARIYEDCVNVEPSDKTLEAYTMELSNALYFIGARVESVGIKEDLTKMAAKEAYNDAYLNHMDVADAKKKPTVAELTALSEDDSKYQQVINSIYTRVYKQLKYKVDSAYEMLNSLRKVISRRMQESQLSTMRSSGGVVYGKEEF
jgi:vacuolar-type H+-ATPase subunit B/Vma2